MKAVRQATVDRRPAPTPKRPPPSDPGTRGPIAASTSPPRAI
ncbi:hypothetical protein BJF96_g2770 [Verticillium dahliae]|uniref:Uncharacterized protein n=1 Tax=Verticillium dahliae TaxID=27337 RepID=A0AA44WLR2_VERDA|nr:hypothetical protein BJF96_g2770 [Verticillium dahliae]